MKRQLGRAGALLLVASVQLGCRSTASEPPPPREKFEVPVAPPGALGAYAAGTDAAPNTAAEPLGSDGEEPPLEEGEPEIDSGPVMPDAGGVPL